MPWMSGWQIAEQLKSINQQIPVAFITGWNVELNAAEKQHKVVDFIIQKPFKVKQIIELVQQGLELREQLNKAV